MDLIVWYKAGSISFVEEPEKESQRDGSAEEMATLNAQDCSQVVESDYL